MVARSIPFSLVFLCAAAAAEGGTESTEARYQAERAACAQLQGAEERATCLREAAAARNAATQGQLNDANNEFERNALARCNALPRSEQDMCLRRTRGEGVVKGSVSEGGIYREYKEITLPSSVPPGDATQ